MKTSTLFPKNILAVIWLFTLAFFSCADNEKSISNIPLPEHPRPDFERASWINLNGYWDFEFDGADKGESESWFDGSKTYSQKILVPFPWGSPLSEVENKDDIAWYKRQITVPEEWKGMRVFLVVGASDWLTKGWIDGREVGQYQGGYTPFEFELTEHTKFGSSQQISLRVDDLPHDFKLFGKQGYGDAKGIWQTVYLEARPKNYIENFYFTPDIDAEKLNVRVLFDKEISASTKVQLKHLGEERSYTIGEVELKSGAKEVTFEVDIPNPKLWSLDDPHLYDVELVLLGDTPDVINTYFGMRKISVVNLPGTDIPYVALNNKPIYLQTALDQAYHPEGYYTFPSDEFIRDEIWRAKEIGLNGQRVHIKVPIPRKLYWADKLGHLIMADVPNSWGQPDADMQRETKVAMEGMFARDYNHPSIFSWVLFNETWGLFSIDEEGKRSYKPETQQWVSEMYAHAKELDKTRLVEDNSPCNYDHVVTDINTWHAYLPGYAWKEFLDNTTNRTFEGSQWNFTKGNLQTDVPMFNSECGNVWGYEGSTGDVDWSWDYHIMMNEFRRHPKVAGWLYTEHHDVINEWNGYWRFDRTDKATGMDEIMEGMSLNDMHSDFYLSTGNEICKTVQGGEEVKVPLTLSSMTGKELKGDLTISYELSTTNYIGGETQSSSASINVAYTPWMQKELEPLSIQVPDVAGLATLKLKLSDQSGTVLHRNFMHFEIISHEELKGVSVLSVPAVNFSKAEWSKKQWNVLDGLKVNGTGEGYFEYTIPISEDISGKRFKNAYFLIEVAAKELFVKDQYDYESGQDFMKGSTVAPSANPNSYPMTDEILFPSDISVLMDGEKVFATQLQDDPADHRGVLSWHHQLKDRKLREAGSYGYLMKVPLKKSMLKEAFEKGKLVVRLQTKGEGGLAVYGSQFGRYPVDPSLVLEE
jgi:hypothetical protein